QAAGHARRRRHAAIVLLCEPGRAARPAGPGRAPARAQGLGTVLGRLRVRRVLEELSCRRGQRVVGSPNTGGPGAAADHHAAGEGAVRASLRTEPPARLGPHPAAWHSRSSDAHVIARSLLSPFDLHLFNEGTHGHLFEKLGAHIFHDPDGTYFAVWAPNADA